MNPNETSYVKNENVSIEFFDKEAVLLNIFKGHYYSFKGETAYYIWTLLSLRYTASSIAEALEQSGVQGNSIALVEGFIAQLLQEEIIQAVTNAPGEPVFPVIEISDTTILPNLEVHTDLQDLILLDPVHDVSSTKGWPYNK